MHYKMRRKGTKSVYTNQSKWYEIWYSWNVIDNNSSRYFPINRIRSLAIYIIDIFCIQTTIFILTVLIERMHKLFRLNCKKWLKKLVVTRPYIAEIEKCKSYWHAWIFLSCNLSAIIFVTNWIKMHFIFLMKTYPRPNLNGGI